MIRKAIIAIVLFVVVPGCSLTTGEAPGEYMGLPLLLDEGFGTLVPDRWAPTDPAAWKLTTDGERGVYALFARSQYKPPVRSPENIAILDGVCVSDLVLDVWVRSTKHSGAHRDICVFFDYKNPQRFYYVHLGAKSDGSSNTIHIVNDKPRTPIVKTRTDGTPWTDDYHHARVVRKVKSGLIEVYFDDMDKPHMTAEDTTFGCGRIGIGSFDDTGNFDRVTLWGHKEH